MSPILFLKTFCSVCSLNSICKKDANNLFSLINLFFNGFIAAYLLFFNLTICALLALLFFDVYNLLLFSSDTVNEVLGLFISNSFGVIWIKLYLFSNTFRFDILSGWKVIS